MKNSTSVSLVGFITLLLPGFLLAEPLDNNLIAKALDQVAEAGQIGGGPGAKEAAKLMKSAESSLKKYLKPGKKVNISGNCHFKNENLSEGPGLKVECEGPYAEIEMYLAPGTDEAMHELKKCNTKCTGEFELVSHPKSGVPKGAHMVGPFGRSLWIWSKPLSVQVSP